jgi:uncharacterized protein (TIGR00369 family)
MSLGCPLLDALPHRHGVEGEQHHVELDITDEMRGPGGSVHGGLLASLVDCAGASAIARASGLPVATSGASLSYLSAARVGPLRASAVPLRMSRHHGVAEVRVFDAGKQDRLVATALVTVTFLAGHEFVRKTE